MIHAEQVNKANRLSERTITTRDNTNNNNNRYHDKNQIQAIPTIIITGITTGMLTAGITREVLRVQL